MFSKGTLFTDLLLKNLSSISFYFETSYFKIEMSMFKGTFVFDSLENDPFRWSSTSGLLCISSSKEFAEAPAAGCRRKAQLQQPIKLISASLLYCYIG